MASEAQPETSHVSPWGNKDEAKSAPIFAPAYVNKGISEENAEGLYETDTTVVGSGTGATVGVYATTASEMASATGVAHAGWNLVKTGTGGRAGRIQTEVLVAMSNMQDKAS